MENTRTAQKPTFAFIGASWIALGLGLLTYNIALWNSKMELNEKGFYLVLLLLGIYSAISLQKTVRDKLEGIPTTAIFYGVTWFVLVASLVILAVGLFNAGSITLSEKGFYGISFALSLFAVVAVQKNVRDLAPFQDESPDSAEDREDKFTGF